MLDMLSLEKLFLYIPGIILFLVGSSQTRIYLRRKKSGKKINGTVSDCKHITKKDRKGRNVYDYYLITVERIQPMTGKAEKLSVKSPTKYLEGQPVTVFENVSGPASPDRGMYIYDSEDFALFQPWEVMIGGALLLLLAFYQNKGDQIMAMLFLVLLFIGSGISLTVRYISSGKKNIRMLKAEIIEVYSRQLTTDSKIIRSGRNTFYPVVRYEQDGRECIRRCHINSSSEKSFPIGDTMTLYQDMDTMLITEKRMNRGTFAAGILLLLVGILSGSSLLTVFL